MKRVMSFIENIFGSASAQAIVIKKFNEKLIIGIKTKPDDIFFHDQYDWNYLPQFQEYLNQPLEQIKSEDQEFVKALRKGTLEELIITRATKYKPNEYDVSFVKNIGQGDEFAKHIADFLNEPILEKLIIKIKNKIENTEKEIHIATNNPGLQLNPICDKVEKQTLEWVLEEIEKLTKEQNE